MGPFSGTRHADPQGSNDSRQKRTGPYGCIPAGVKCFSLNPEAVSTTCKQCKANLALREHRAVCTEEVQNGNRIIGYWMPLKDDREVYVHFGIGVAESMGMKPNAPAATAELVNLPH